MNKTLMTLILALMTVGSAQADIVLEVSERQFVADVMLPSATDNPIEAISVELGGYDVSEFTELTGTSLVVNLATPLGLGSHELAVLAFYQNGDVDVIKSTMVTVNTGANTALSTWSTNATIDGSYRVDQKEDIDFKGIDHFRTNAGLTVSGGVTQDSWSVSTEIQALYDSNSETNPDNAEFVLPFYNVGITKTNDWGDFGASVGDQQIGTEGLLFNSYQRRGVAANVSALDTVSLNAFNVHSQPTSSYSSDLAQPDNSEERAYGGQLSVSPLTTEHKDKLTLGFGYINGEVTNDTGQEYNLYDVVRYGGSAWNTSISSAWLNSSLVFDYEYAESSFDLDGIGIGQDEVTDDAYKVAVTASSFGDLGSGIVDQWLAKLSREEVGREYYSLGNLYIPGDLATDQFILQAAVGGFTVSSEVSQIDNNVEDRIDVPDQSTRYAAVDWFYTPYDINPDGAIVRWLGMPSLNGYVRLLEREQDDDDAFLAGFDVDNDTQDISLALNFAKEKWNWSVQHTQVEFTDNSAELFSGGFLIYQPQSDSTNEMTVLQLTYAPTPYLQVSPLLQYNRLEEHDINDTYKTEYVGLDLQAHLIPDELILNLYYSVNQDNNDLRSFNNATIDVESEVADFKLTWKTLTPQAVNPGLDLYAKGSYGRQLDNVSSFNNETWQFHIGFTLYWAEGEF